MEECENCKFWKLAPKEKREEQCRRHAPKPEILRLEVPFWAARWLVTQRSDWCGEYEPKQLRSS